MEEIKNNLINLGVRIRSVGFLYWIDAFQYVMACPKTFHMMEVYDAISLKRGKSISSIERAMRYALEPAEKNIQDKFNYYKKIDNMTFINLMRIGEI